MFPLPSEVYLTQVPRITTAPLHQQTRVRLTYLETILDGSSFWAGHRHEIFIPSGGRSYEVSNMHKFHAARNLSY